MKYTITDNIIFFDYIFGIQLFIFIFCEIVISYEL